MRGKKAKEIRRATHGSTEPIRREAIPSKTNRSGMADMIAWPIDSWRRNYQDNKAAYKRETWKPTS